MCTKIAEYTVTILYKDEDMDPALEEKGLEALYELDLLTHFELEVVG